MATRIYQEITNDRGAGRICFASDNFVEYIITSSYGRDLVDSFEERHERRPSGRWFHRNFRLERIK